MTVRKSLAQQEEYRVRDTDGDREPVTEAGRNHNIVFHPDWGRGQQDILAIEHEAALLARRAPGDRDRVADALREAYTLLVSATPALIRDAKQAERPGASPEYRRRSALLRDKVDEWLVPYREHFDQGLAVLRADSRPEQPDPDRLLTAGERLFTAAFDYAVHVDPASMRAVDPRAVSSAAVVAVSNPNPDIGTPETDLQDALKAWMAAAAASRPEQPAPRPIGRKAILASLAEQGAMHRAKLNSERERQEDQATQVAAIEKETPRDSRPEEPRE